MLIRFLAWLERHGRKKCAYGFDGTLIGYRWYLFYMEDDEDSRALALLPNWYLHEALVEHPDGPDRHSHAWPTRSLLLRGACREEVDGRTRWYRRWWPLALGVGQLHRIAWVMPGTMTLFMHGFRRGPWRFRMRPCAELCATCGPMGRCASAARDLAYGEYFGRGARKAVEWHLSTEPALEARMARRRAAVAKLAEAGRLLRRDQVNARECARAAEEMTHV